MPAMGVGVEAVNYYTDLGIDSGTTLVGRGDGVWKGFEMDFSERESAALREMTALVGSPSLVAVRYLWRSFSQWKDIAGVGGVFYVGTGVETQKRFTVPVGFAIGNEFTTWIEEWRGKLAAKWQVATVNYGVTGRLWSEFEMAVLRPLAPEVERNGCLGFWDNFYGRDRLLHYLGQRFLMFVDVDCKLDDQELIRIEREVGSPFWKVMTERGVHLIFPVVFDNGLGGRGVEAKVNSIILLGFGHAGVGLDIANRGHVGFDSEPVIRVVGRGDSSPPVVEAVVWDGKVYRD